MISEKEKQDLKFNNCWFDTKKKLWFWPNNNLKLLGTLKFSLLTTVHALNHWFTDKTIDFMNHYWWGNINKIAKSAYLTCPVVWSAAWGSLFVLFPGILNCLMDHLKSGKQASFNFLHLMDTNMLSYRKIKPYNLK